MHDYGCEQGCSVQEVVRQGISLPVKAEVVRFFVFHEVDGVCSEWDEDDLHDEDVECLPSKEEVDIPAEEHH